MREPLSDALLAEVRNALLRWKVVFFRDQDITTEQHLAFARRFGELEVHPFARNMPGYPEVIALDRDENRRGNENFWHSDVTWRLEPSLGSVLRALYVNVAFTRQIVDMEPEQSAQLLRLLYAQAAIPEYQCQFRWQVNSIAFWDNRATQHYAVSDYWPDVRRMQRVTICGDRPV